MKRTAIYIRVSSDIQAKEGDSIPAQRDALLKYIKEKPDLVLAGEYIDDGVSGQKFEQRDELQRMLQDVKDGKIDLLIFTKLDRFFRSVRHYAATQELLDKYGVKWLAIWEPMYDTTTPAGQLIINQMMSFAQFEAQNTGSRIRQVQAYKVQKGEVISGATPPGYKIKNKHLVPDKCAPSVKEAFRYYSFSGNLTETVLHCKSLPGLPRTKPAFKKMLMNQKYIGKHRGNDHFCEPLIDEALFEDVQKKLIINVKSSATHTYIFRGLITCEECGHHMGGAYRIFHRQKGDVLVKYYRCPRHFNEFKDCQNGKFIRENVLERYLLEHIKTEIKKYILECEVKSAPAKDNQARIKTLEKKIVRLKDLYIDELISIEEYKADKEKFLAEMEDLKKQENPEIVDTSKLQKICEMNLEEIYSTFTEEEKRYFWRSIIKEIRFGLNRKYRIFF